MLRDALRYTWITLGVIWAVFGVLYVAAHWLNAGAPEPTGQCNLGNWDACIDGADLINMLAFLGAVLLAGITALVGVGTLVAVIVNRYRGRAK